MKDIRKIGALVLIIILVLIMAAQAVPAPPPGQGGSPPGLSDITGWTVDGSTVYKSDLEGNVGIGMVDPQYKLDVEGDVHASGGFIAGSTTEYGDGFIDLSPGTDLSIDSDTIFVDNTNNRVGIGLNNPEVPLDINRINERLTIEGWNPGLKLGRGSALIWDKGNIGENYFFMAGPNTHQVGDFYAGLTPTIDGTSHADYVYKIYGQSRVGEPTAGTTRFLHNVLVDENVGIGTLDPNAPLEVYYDNIFRDNPAIMINNPNFSGQDVIEFSFSDLPQARIRKANGGNMFISTLTNQGITFRTNDINRMTVTNSGDVE
jgi:hypothetical protein